MYCPYCGSRVSGESDLCPACGKSIYATKRPRKRASFLHALLILIIVFSAAAVYFAYSLKLYYNESSCEIDANFLVKGLIAYTDIETYYDDTFLLVEDGVYTFFSPENGALESIAAEELGVPNSNGVRVNINLEWNYAYLRIYDPDYYVLYSFRKATLPERFRFLSLYLSFS